jgi:hypothetical protein
MTETWPTSMDELRQEYASLCERLGKFRAVPVLAGKYGMSDHTARRRLIAAGLYASKPKPQRPSLEDLRSEYKRACSEHGARAAVSKMAAAHGVDYVSVRRWLTEAGLRDVTPRIPPRPITTPCPCGAVATTRYQGQDPPLCINCYGRAYTTDNPPARSGRLYAIAAKEGKACTDCGGVFHQAAMEFDHIPERGPKLFNLGQSDRSVEAVKTEIAKCDIVCANCHRIRTWNRNHGQAEQPAS